MADPMSEEHFAEIEVSDDPGRYVPELIACIRRMREETRDDVIRDLEERLARSPDTITGLERRLRRSDALLAEVYSLRRTAIAATLEIEEQARSILALWGEYEMLTDATKRAQRLGSIHDAVEQLREWLGPDDEEDED